MPENELLLDAGSRVLHIGPPKTGTTAIQGALKQARQAMAARGVVYPGKDRQHWMAARAVLGTHGPKGDPPVDPKCWDRLVKQVSAAGDKRVIVSAEGFAGADEANVRKVTTALGGPRVHVVVTLRPLVKVLPSAYQQLVRKGLRASYETWLSQTLGRPTETSDKGTFWQRHRHDRLVSRWAAVVGADNVTAVVVDDSDRLMLMRVFEQLLGLPVGLLEPELKTNPSLTFGEIELVRQLNVEFHRRGWSWENYRSVVGKGLIPYLLYTDRRTLDDQRIQNPAWAVDCASDIGRATAEGIAASGVRIVGDISTLGRRPDGTSAPSTAPEAMVPSKIATHAVVATILAAAPKSSGLTAPKNDGRAGAAAPRPTRTKRRGSKRRRSQVPPVPAGHVPRRRNAGRGNRPASPKAAGANGTRPAGKAPEPQRSRSGSH